MATIAGRVGGRLVAERRFFLGMAAAMAVLTFIGFAPSYYLSTIFAGPRLSLLVHVHGAIFTLWMLLYVVQTGLISAGRTDVHRIVGSAAVLVAVAMVPLGIATAIITKQAAAAAHLPPSGPPLAFPLGAVLTFAVLTGWAVAMRRRAAWHKRLMLLGTLALLTTPLARVTRMSHLPLTPPLGGMVLTDLLLLVLVAYDLRTTGKLHAATKWGGAFFLLTQVIRIVLNMTPAWQAFAKSLTG
ncbi:hypothetical protein [Sphingomonas asaccharolytica]|uniref:hypothetical protein n=1 Tax=Sphingomonas asaccharolytica TaxID=40681 RepID=UPI000B113B56|nr:hypothetical protein [Sphingomonas asaccharolytica]